MIKKTVTYTDWDGEDVTESLWFNMNKAELLELNKKYGSALDKFLRRSIEKEQYTKLAVFWKDFILKAYGTKTDDGKHFVKSDEAAKEFYQSIAFDIIFDEVLGSDAAADAFVNGVLNGIRLTNGENLVAVKGGGDGNAAD